MDHFQGIILEIISNGQVLDLYDNPDAVEVEDSRSCHLYVEAVPGSTFQVKVNLTPEFEFYQMNDEHFVYIGVKPDGGRSLHTHCKKKYLQKKFSLGKAAVETFTGPRQFCKETGQWTRSDYCFSNLVLKENSDPGFSVKQAQDIGKIQILIKRVKPEKRQIHSLPNTKPLATINEIPEKALKGRPIETTVGFVNARPTTAPRIHTTEYKSIDGEAGKPVVYNIYYRSKHALQMLGCIPRIPSPIPKDDSTAPEDTLQEVLDLRARLAVLERGLNVKSEAPIVTTGVKRERDDKGDNETRQKRRVSAKVEHVDLTSD